VRAVETGAAAALTGKSIALPRPQPVRGTARDQYRSLGPFNPVLIGRRGRWRTACDGELCSWSLSGGDLPPLWAGQYLFGHAVLATAPACVAACRRSALSTQRAGPAPDIWGLWGQMKTSGNS